MKLLRPLLLIWLIWLCMLPEGASAQTYTITGRVTDATTGEPIPYANVYFRKLRIGNSTSFEGFYTITTTQIEDSLTAQFLGFQMKARAVKKGQYTQTINFQLEPEPSQLGEVVITPDDNPALKILRKVKEHKPDNDKSKLDAYQYESYSKVELAADNISEKFRNNAAMRPFSKIFDSLNLASGDDGRPILPFFISETISDFYYLKNPERKTEHIKASKLSGVGLDDGSLVSQLVGSSLQDYNFYDNWLSIVEKNFASPIADAGPSYYYYYLMDSLVIDGMYCYKIEFKPKRPRDLVFTGTMWITDTTFALKRIVVEVGRDANLNYLERIKIQQDLVPTTAGPWIPAKVRILVDIAEITDKSFGMLAKMYTSVDDIQVDQPKKLKFYEDRISVAEDALQKDAAFWDKNRHDSLTDEDKAVMHLIDTIKNMPRVKTYIDVADFLVNGHYHLGGIDIGPYSLLYGNNIEEGHRFRLGATTNAKFSRYWILKAYAAVGTRDYEKNGIKYGGTIERFLSRKSWTKIGIQHRYDIQGLGVPDDFFNQNALLNTSAQLGLLTRLNLVKLNRLWIESDIMRGLNVRSYIMTKNMMPRGKFEFGYFLDPNHTERELQTDINTTEVAIEARYAFKETYIINDNKRARVGLDKAPVLTLNYTRGIKGLLGGQFNYNKVSLDISQLMPLGIWGRGEYNVKLSKVFEQLPYPLLNIMPGNETFIRTLNTFNMMRFFEFVTDRSATVFYTQHFDGLLMNRVPLLKRLKWRTVAGFKVAWGDISNRNTINSEQYPKPSEKYITQFSQLDPSIPYTEVSYGIENIFHFLRIDFIHRLTYLDADAPRFAVKGSLYFSF